MTIQNNPFASKKLKSYFALNRTPIGGNYVSAKGFTLIELLIVIAILGVLATVVLVAINPLEQLARTRDSGRKSAVAQIGRSLQAFATSHDNALPDPTTWNTDLEGTGELQAFPVAIQYSAGTVTPCTTNNVNDYCYSTDGDTPPSFAIVFARLESASETARCTTGDPYTVYDTVLGRGGLVCSATEPAYDASGQTFID